MVILLLWWKVEWEMTTKESHWCVRCNRMWITLLMLWRRPDTSSYRKFVTLESWGFCFVTVESWPAGWVSPLFDFWAATNSWALTGHSGICFIRGERGGSRRATHLCDSSEPHATLTTLTSYSNYPTSALFVLSLTQIRLLRKNDTGIKGTEQKVNVCWLPRTEEVKKGHILQVQLSGAVTCKTNRCPKTFLKRLSLDTGIVDLFSL